MTPIAIDFYGKIYLGSYEHVNKDMVSVSSLGLGSMVTQISDSTPESVARMLLREIVREAHKKRQMGEQEVM